MTVPLSLKKYIYYTIQSFWTFDHIDAFGRWEHIAKLSKTATLKFINITQLITLTADTLTKLKLGGEKNAISKFYKKTSKKFGALNNTVTDVILKKYTKKYIVFGKLAIDCEK